VNSVTIDLIVKAHRRTYRKHGERRGVVRKKMFVRVRDVRGHLIDKTFTFDVTGLKRKDGR
jgi:hypothetical protein